MPLDASAAANPNLDLPSRTRPVAIWLFGVCFMLFGMVVLGGVTRLTGSGLSIMEWAPLSGALPPMNETEWQRLFALYRKIPQYQLQNAGFGLDGFKHIFWLEWAHRLWGRLMGLAFFLPLVWFALTGQIRRRMLPRLVLLLVLGGLQGAVGWFMVASGFMAGSTSVSAYRLVMHLALALALYAAVLWTGLGIWHPMSPPGRRGRGVRRLAGTAAVLVCLTIVAGGFVAGLHAGLTYNSFPLMDGRLVPAGYASLPFPRDWFENIAAVQFDHRLLATLTAATTVVLVLAGWRAAPWARPVLAALGLLVAAQYALGVATLLSVVAIPLAAAHQACAVLVLTAILVLLHRLRDTACAWAPPGQSARPSRRLIAVGAKR